MTDLPSPPVDAGSLPDRRRLIDVAWAAYFVVLLVAPIVVPPVVATSTRLAYPAALLQVISIVGIGYVVGLVTLTRPI